MAAYGSIWASGNAVASSHAVADTYYQITIFTDAGPSNGCNGDPSNDHISVPVNGVYLVNCAIAFSGQTGDTIGFKIHKNNGATAFDQLHIHRKLGSADVGACSLAGLVELDAGDTVELWSESDDTNDITIQDVQLSVLLVS